MQLELSMTPTVRPGEDVTISVRGLPEAIYGQHLQIELSLTDATANMFKVAFGAPIDGNGCCDAAWAPEESVDGILQVRTLKVTGEDGTPIWIATAEALPISLCLVAEKAEDLNAAQVEARFEELQKTQNERYEVPLGDVHATGHRRYAVLCLVERLLVTTRLRIPGVLIGGMNDSSAEVEQPEFINLLLGGLGVPTRIDLEQWAEISRANRPWTALIMPSVWAASAIDAIEVARDHRDRALELLALNRLASAHPVIILASSTDGPPDQAVSHEDVGYPGNLIGGFISGENQYELLAQSLAIDADPLLRLAVRLAREAIAERNADAAYLRFWSILEVLSTSRVPSGQSVSLVNGSPWPGGSGTTTAAAPRVYELVKRYMAQGSYSEASLAGPSPSLHAAVRGWYARRNATAHYGAFVDSDSVQKGQKWYPDALATRTGALVDEPEPWLGTLRGLTLLLIRYELQTVGGSLV